MIPMLQKWDGLEVYFFSFLYLKNTFVHGTQIFASVYEGFKDEE